MATILGIDPGPVESAYALIDADSRMPLIIDKIGNHRFAITLSDLCNGYRPLLVAVEMVASFGMPVGAEVFQTCVWAGRFIERAETGHGVPSRQIPRPDVKLHHCHSRRAKDPNVIQALVDRFAPGAPNRGKGTKSAPGWFYGFRDDIWQAYACAVTAADQEPR